MARRMLPLLGTLTAGVTAGLLIATLYLRADDRTAAGQASPHPATADTSPVTSHPVGLPADLNPRLQALERQLLEFRLHGSALEEKIERLNERLERLDSGRFATTPSANVAGSSAHPVTDTAPDTEQIDRPLTLATLVGIGIDEQLAQAIIQREGEREMQRLELRDRAVRDGSFGTEAYFQTLQTLNDGTTALREAIGDDAYDRYLHATGQPNRVLISSVIPGSPAEQAGIQAGDILLDYAGTRVFDWSELREATTQGERSEYVQVMLLRASDPLTLFLPRGPLGVRLDSTRETPAGY